jgi:hypothetical protein
MNTKKRVVSWVIEVEWEDGTFEKIADIPSHTASWVDGYLSHVEDERNEEVRDGSN